MKATRFNHVSIHAVDMEESLRFYIEVFGMEHLPSPDFEQRVEWLRIGEQQLHLFLLDTPAPRFHHLSLEVDDFEAAYVSARDRAQLDDRTFGPSVRELNDGSVQMYLRDPASNLVEINWPDITTLDRTVITDFGQLRDERPQSPEALRASLFFKR